MPDQACFNIAFDKACFDKGWGEFRKTVNLVVNESTN